MTRRLPVGLVAALGVVAHAALAAIATGSMPLSPGPEDYLRLAVNLEKIKGHLAALDAAAALGEPEGGHAEAALERRFPRLAGSLLERDAALHDRLARALRDLVARVSGRASAAEIQDAVGSLERLVERARQSLIPVGVLERPEFAGQVIWALLNEVAEEFEEALGEEEEEAGGPADHERGAEQEEEEEPEQGEDGPSGGVRSLQDYQEAWGYLQRARALWEEVLPHVRQRSPEAAAGVGGVIRRFERFIASVEPPRVAGSPEELEAALDDALYWLVEATGAPLSAGAEAGEALGRVEALLVRCQGAYGQGKQALALELAYAAADEYAPASGPLRFLAPDLDRRIRWGLQEDLLGAIGQQASPQAVDRAVQGVLQALARARSSLGIL